MWFGVPVLWFWTNVSGLGGGGGGSLRGAGLLRPAPLPRGAGPAELEHVSS